MSELVCNELSKSYQNFQLLKCYNKVVTEVANKI